MKKLLPASVVNQVAKSRAQEAEERQGYKPGRKQMKDIKEAVTDELIPKAFSIFRDTRVWIDPVNRWLLIDTTSAAKAEEVLALLSKSIDSFPLQPVQVPQSPAAAMTCWLAADEAPAGFTIDQDTELRATGDSRAAIRYVRQSIEAAEVRKHIDEGKQCTRLAMTWRDRISFVLTEALTLKRIAPLDVRLKRHRSCIIIEARPQQIKQHMTLASQRALQRAHARIDAIHASLGSFELLCSGTLSQRMMTCGKPNCRCATDPGARHGPYYQWVRMRAGKPSQRYVSEQQAVILHQAIENYRQVKKLLREWEENTERLIDAVQPPQP